MVKYICHKPRPCGEIVLGIIPILTFDLRGIHVKSRGWLRQTGQFRKFLQIRCRYCIHSEGQVKLHFWFWIKRSTMVLQEIHPTFTFINLISLCYRPNNTKIWFAPGLLCPTETVNHQYEENSHKTTAYETDEEWLESLGTLVSKLTQIIMKKCKFCLLMVFQKGHTIQCPDNFVRNYLQLYLTFVEVIPKLLLCYKSVVIKTPL